VLVGSKNKQFVKAIDNYNKRNFLCLFEQIDIEPASIISLFASARLPFLHSIKKPHLGGYCLEII